MRQSQIKNRKSSSSWRDVFAASAFFAAIKFSVGMATVVLLYNFFSVGTILLLKQISLIRKLPGTLSLGIKHHSVNEMIAGRGRDEAFSTFFLVKLTAYFLSAIITIMLSLSAGFPDLSLWVVLSLLVLFTLAFCNETFQTVYFSEGKLTILVYLTSLRTALFPIGLFFFGERFQIFAWLGVMITVEVVLLTFLIAHSFKYKFNWRVQLVPMPRVIDSVRKSFIFFLEARFFLALESFLFFVVARSMAAFDAALLAMLLTISLTFVNLVGSTIQKKTLFDLVALISDGDRSAAFKIEASKTITNYVAFCFVALGLVGTLYGTIIYLFIEKFANHSELIAFSIAVAVMHLVSSVIIRAVFASQDRRSLGQMFFVSLSLLLLLVLACLSDSLSVTEILAITTAVFAARLLSFSLLLQRCIGALPIGFSIVACCAVFQLWSFALLNNEANFIPAFHEGLSVLFIVGTFFGVCFSFIPKLTTFLLESFRTPH